MKKLLNLRALFMLLIMTLATNVWGETKTGSWDLTSASTDWTASLNETYFSQPYGFKKANGTLTNKSISDFSTSGITQIKVGFKCLQNGGTSSKLTIYLVDKDGNALGSGVIVTPDNKSSASQTTYQYATFTTNLTGATGFMMKVTTFGKNILVNGAEYEVTYTTSGGGETPEPTKYTVTVANDIANGTVTASPTSAAAGAEVTLTATPNTGYEFGSWNVTDASSNAITVTDNKFTMPAANVNVSAAFNEIPVFEGTTTTMSADEDADIRFIKGASNKDQAFWVYSNPLSANNLTLSGSNNSSSSYSYYDGSVVRFYQNNSFTITPSNGATIVKVEIVRQSTTGSNGGTINCSGLTAASENTTTNTNVYTGSATSAVTFTAEAQARFTKIIVYTTGGKTLQSITVSGTPTKTTYIAGENFDPAGLTVTGHYDDNSDETITEGITWSTPAALATGQTSVSITATVNGITSPTYEVTGLTVNAPKTLSSIAVSGTPAEFWKGDEFNHDGITVTATWSDETQTDVTSDCSFTGYNMSTVGGQTVTVSYQEKTATYNITIKTIANTAETAYTVAQAKALIDAGKDLATEVYVKGIVSQIVTEYSSSYGNISFNVSADGQTTGDQFQFFRNFKGANKEKWGSADEAPVVGAEVIGYGTLAKYNSTYEFAEGNYIVSMVKPEVPEKQDATITIDNITIEEDETITISATTTPANAELTYEIVAGGMYITLEGNEITGVEEGTATVQASFAGNEEYNPAKVEFTVTVTKKQGGDEPTPGEGEVAAGTYDIAINNALWGTKESGAYNGTIPEFLSGTSHGVTITFTKGEGANLYINDEETRIYAKEALTVSVPEGYSITKIVNTSSSKKSATITTTPTGYDAETKTWEGKSQSVAFTVDDANGFQTLTVTYVEGAATPDTPIEPTPDYGTINFVATNDDGYWATFSSTKDVIFPADGDIVPELVGVVDNQLLKTDISDESWTMVTDPNVSDQEGIYGYYIPAGTGVLLYSTETSGTYYFVKDYEWNQTKTINPSDNMLVPCTTNGIYKAEDDGNYYYKLAYGDNTNKTKLGFWWGANDGSGNFKVKAGGAILCVPQSIGAKLSGFSFDDAETNGINSINANINVNEPIYNIAGQRVNANAKGILIQNGRKYLNK